MRTRNEITPGGDAPEKTSDAQHMLSLQLGRKVEPAHLLQGAAGKRDGPLQGAAREWDRTLKSAAGQRDGTLEGAAGKGDGALKGAAGKRDRALERAAGERNGTHFDWFGCWC